MTEDWSTEKCPKASWQGSSWFNLTTAMGAQAALEVSATTSPGKCAIPWAASPLLAVFGGHCQLTDVSLHSLGPLEALQPLCSPEPVGSSPLPCHIDSATAQALPSHISAGWVSSHPGSRVYSTSETLWELLASNCDVSLAGKQGEETCCCSMSERFTISSRAPGHWVCMRRARLPVSEAQGTVILLFIAH